MRVVVNGHLMTPMGLHLDQYVLRHVGYEDPVKAIAQDPKVTLVSFHKEHAVFVAVRDGFDVYDRYTQFF